MESVFKSTLAYCLFITVYEVSFKYSFFVNLIFNYAIGIMKTSACEYSMRTLKYNDQVDNEICIPF